MQNHLLVIIAASTAISAGARILPLFRLLRNWVDRRLAHHRAKEL